MFHSILNIDFKCQTTVIFGIMKDGSLMRNTLSVINCLIDANDISEMVNMIYRFLSKRSGSSDFVQNLPVVNIVSKIRVRNYKWYFELLLLVSSMKT